MEEDSVQLIDFLRVIGKRKTLIITGTLLCVAITLAVIFILPKTYKTYTVIEIGKMYFEGDTRIVESFPILESKILNSYQYKAITELNIPEKKLPDLFIKGDRIITISSNTKDINLALNILNKINTYILEDHERFKNESISQLTNKTSSIDAKIITNGEEKKLLLQKLLLLKENKKNTQERIKDTKERMEEQLLERQNLASGNNVNHKIEVMIYSNQIKEYQDYYNRLEDRLRFDIENNELEIRNGIERINESLKTLELEKQTLKSTIEYINKISTKIISEPDYLRKPVKPQKALYSILAGILGSTFFILLAFFLEYLEKVKLKERNS